MREENAVKMIGFFCLQRTILGSTGLSHVTSEPLSQSVDRVC